MLRTKLIATFSGVLVLVVGMAGLLFWGTREIRYNYERGLMAHEVLETYVHLSTDAYRHFKQLVDLLVLDAALDRESVQEGEHRLQATLRHLEHLTRQEVAFVGQNEPEEAGELEQIDHLSVLIDRGAALLKQAADMQGQGRELAAQTTLIAALENLIDQEFATVIDAAIAEEQREVEVSDRLATELAEWIGLAAGGAALIAVVGVGTAGVVLLRRIEGPLAKLMAGTRAIAHGRLGHRIDLEGPGELAQLALSFNRMAAELEQQQGQLLLARTGLERKVKERTEELEAANVALQRLDQVRRHMFADISHELRTPLTVIRGEAEVTLRSRRGAPEEYRASLERIVDLTGQLARLVEDLMMLARSESAAVRLKVADTALTPLLMSVCEDAQVLAGEKGVDVVWTLPDDPVVVRGDLDRLRQLLLILIDNACQYTLRGQISVALALEPPEAVITVADTGVGIAQEERQWVFDRYFRGARAQRLAPRGTGLGLHVAKVIADAHDGSIQLAGRPGAGTEVTVRLPLAQPLEGFDDRLAG